MIFPASFFSFILSAFLKNRVALQDVYGILSVMNGKSVKQIAAQPVLDTMRQTAELFRDEDLLSFFRLSAQPGAAPRSAPSAPSPGSE